jgi:carnitine-CoA ligase
VDLQDLTVRRFLEEAVERNLDRTLLVWGDREYTYREVNEHVDRAAHLWSNLGVVKGDRVAFMMENRPEFLFAWLGLAKIGGILVAINTRFRSEEAGFMVRHSEARFGLVDRPRWEVFAQVAASSPSLESVLSVDPGGGHPVYGDLVRDLAPSAPEVDLVGDDVISLIYTSGTTGTPKGVMQTHKNYVMTGQSYPHWVRMVSTDRSYMCLPLFHINAQAYQTMGALGAESTIVMAPRFSATNFWEEVRHHRITVWNYVGAMMVILSKQPESPQDRDNDIRIAYSGGGVSALDGETRTAIESRYGLKLLGGFGMSETTFGCVEPYDSDLRPGSIGFPRQHPDPEVPRNEARIVDDEGKDVEPGQVGELAFRNAATARGYFRDPERTSEAFRDGWLYTGDLARQDDEGFYYYVDRKKDIIRRRGENISSVEVERTLRSHPAVADAAAVAVPGELPGDEEAQAFVVIRAGETVAARELWDWVEERLASFKVPRYIQFVDELPKTSTQKVEKRRLRELAGKPAERFDRGV